MNIGSGCMANAMECIFVRRLGVNLVMNGDGIGPQLPTLVYQVRIRNPIHQVTRFRVLRGLAIEPWANEFKS